MLLAQKICLQWDKKERGVKGGKCASSFSTCVPFGETAS